MEARIVELETRLAFQEDTIHHLSEILATQQRSIDKLTKSLELLRQRLQAFSPSPLEGGGEEPPPPHY